MTFVIIVMCKKLFHCVVLSICDTVLVRSRKCFLYALSIVWIKMCDKDVYCTPQSGNPFSVPEVSASEISYNFFHPDSGHSPKKILP
jgi:hypothetical protein